MSNASFRIIFALLASAAALPASSDWLRLYAGNVEIYTDAGLSSARDALKRFDQMRRVFEARTGRGNLAPLPVRVFLFRNQSEFKPFQITGNAAGYYQSGPERDYIAMQAGGPDADRVVYHEYAHLLMRHAGYAVPVWLNEGIAELYSTVSFGNAEVRIGDLIPSHIATLRDVRLLDLPLLLDITGQSPYYNERGKAGIFYAQSWALVHMLNFSSSYQPGTANFLARVLSGEPPARAFDQAFGKTLSKVHSDLLHYIRQGRYVGIRLRAPPSDSSGKALPELVDPLQSQLLLADLLLAIHRDEQAAALLTALEPRYPNSPELLAARGDLAVRGNDDAKARSYYEQSVAAGSVSGRVRYDLAMLRRESGQPEAAVVAARTGGSVRPPTFSGVPFPRLPCASVTTLPASGSSSHPSRRHRAWPRSRLGIACACLPLLRTKRQSAECRQARSQPRTQAGRFRTHRRHPAINRAGS
ncbi:MAG: hypothetical protein WKF37_14290 [Bryobacteraceae bacterium]